MIPLFTTNLLDGMSVPLYGDGLNERDWIYVDDHCAGVHLALQRGEPGEIYNIGAGNETPNRVLVDKLLALARPGRRPRRVRRRPARARPPLLRRHREDHRARMASGAHARRSPRRDRRVVPRQSLVVGTAEGPMKVLVTGAGGQVGRELVDALAPHEVIACTHADLDAGDRESALAVITSARPDAIVHCAAWTNVDGCESDTDRAFRDNALANRNVMEAARRVGAYVVALSTDYVFDGEKDEPYHEWDTPNPLSVYGASKLAGEFEIDPDCAVVRTSWVCGQHGSNAVKTILRLAQQKGNMRFVTDQRGSPTIVVRPRGRAARLRRSTGCRAPGTSPTRARSRGTSSPASCSPPPATIRAGWSRSRPPSWTRPVPRPAPRTPSSTTARCASPAAPCSPTTATPSTASSATLLDLMRA